VRGRQARGILPLFIGRSGTTHQLFAAGRTQAPVSQSTCASRRFPELLAENGFARVDF